MPHSAINLAHNTRYWLSEYFLGNQIISEPVYRKLIAPVESAGGVVLCGTPDVEAHLEKMGASASTLGDVILFRKDATTSDVLEETYHFWQNKRGLNNDKPGELRTILNEIDAKQYLLSVTKKYKIPLEEVELTQNQLKEYRRMLDDWKGRYGL